MGGTGGVVLESTGGGGLGDRDRDPEDEPDKLLRLFRFGMFRLPRLGVGESSCDEALRSLSFFAGYCATSISPSDVLRRP